MCVASAAPCLGALSERPSLENRARRRVGENANPTLIYVDNSGRWISRSSIAADAASYSALPQATMGVTTPIAQDWKA